jgi:hypothetical protein
MADIPSLAEQNIAGREFELVKMPMNFAVYCVLCNVRSLGGMLMKKYDGATYIHETCPTTPFRTFAPHKYGNAR